MTTSSPTLGELIARIPREGWFTLGMHGHRWSAGLRLSAHGAWMFCGGETAEEAVREVLAKIPCVTQRPACNICRVELDQPGKSETRDCGGDCLKCMAAAGDAQCQRELDRLELIG